MKCVNKVTLMGHLGSDPELRRTGNGTPVCNFTMATNESWGGKDGSERQERVEWHKIVAWKRLAEICDEYLKKGRQVYIEGRIQTREWTDKNGEKRYSTEIVAMDMIMLGGTESSQERKPKPAAVPSDEPPYIADDGDDLPF